MLCMILTSTDSVNNMINLLEHVNFIIKKIITHTNVRGTVPPTSLGQKWGGRSPHKKMWGGRVPPVLPARYSHVGYSTE